MEEPGEGRREEREAVSGKHEGPDAWLHRRPRRLTSGMDVNRLAVVASVWVVLAAVAAVASVFGPEAVARVTGGWWFSAPAVAAAGAALVLSAVGFVRGRRRVAAIVAHLGLVVGLAGIVLDARAPAGHLFLEQGAGERNLFLAAGLDRADVLSDPLALDSITETRARGFSPAPLCWLRSAQGAFPVGYNRPGRAGGVRVLFSRAVEPGFLVEYEVAVDSDEYLLLHNQRVRLADGASVASFGFDPQARTVGLSVAGESSWLGPGATAVVGGHQLTMRQVWFAGNRGAIFRLSDTRFRPLLFAGFGLVLAGVALAMVGRARG